jgi:glycolate oxidase FAD binding subunit
MTTGVETFAAPADEEELAALVRAAAGEGRALVTEGGGTKRHFGAAAPAGARLVSLSRLARIAHEPADMILSVGAGATLAEVQRVLAAHDQWLPLDPPFVDVDARASVGGVLATGSSGPRRLGYGTARDLLLGLRVVGARGQVTKSGGRVVKNVSGYDLHRPQVGAFGSLGVIVEAHFKVAARPETSALWALPCAALEDAHGLLLEIAASALRPVALEALDGAAADLVRTRAPLPGAAGQAVAVVGVEGSRTVFERHARDLATYAARGRGAPALVERPAAGALWEALADLPAMTAGDVRVRVGARPHDLPGLLAALELGRAPIRAASVRVGTGLAHISLACGESPGASSAASTLAALVERWRRLASARDGYALVESAPLALAGRALLPFGAGGPTAPHAALRRAWDPGEILNPGRMAL